MRVPPKAPLPLPRRQCVARFASEGMESVLACSRQTADEVARRALRTYEGSEFRISVHKRHWISVRALLPQARSVCEHCSNGGNRGSLEKSLLRVHSIIMYPCLIVVA